MPVIVVDDQQLDEPVSAYHIQGEKDSPLFLLIPGNPGVCQYYSEYLEELKSLHPSYELLCASHRGMDAVLNPKGTVSGTVTYSLHDQVDHACNVLNWATSNATPKNPREVLIMGHSMGAWVVQRVVLKFQNNPNVRFKMVGLITPTVRDIALSPKGTKLTWIINSITKNPGYVLGRTAQFLYKTLPNAGFTYAVKLGLGGWSSTPSHAVNSTIDMLSRPSILVQVGQMSVEEMLLIKEDLPEFWNSSITKGKEFPIWAYFAHNDPWISDLTRSQIIDDYSHLPTFQFDLPRGDPSDSITHSFCLRQSSRFAKITSYRISQIMSRPPS